MNDIMQKVNKKFGRKVVVPASMVPSVQFRPSGLSSFDAQVGGIPVGRLILISGLPATGKSTFCYKVAGMASASLLIDAEGGSTPEWGALFGLSDDNLIVARPKDMDEAYSLVDECLKEYELDYIIIDSAASMASRGEMARDADENGALAERAVLNNALCRRVIARTRINPRTSVILIQHLYQDPSAARYGGSYVLSGGWGQQYLNSLHIQCSRVKTIYETVTGEGNSDEDKRIIAFVLRWKVDHSKVSPDGVNGLWRLYIRQSVDENAPKVGTMDDSPELLRLCRLVGVVKVRGSWYILWEGSDKEKKVQGEAAAMDMVMEAADELIPIIRQALGAR